MACLGAKRRGTKGCTFSSPGSRGVPANRIGTKGSAFWERNYRLRAWAHKRLPQPLVNHPAKEPAGSLELSGDLFRSLTAAAEAVDSDNHRSAVSLNQNFKFWLTAGLQSNCKLGLHPRKVTFWYSISGESLPFLTARGLCEIPHLVPWQCVAGVAHRACTRKSLRQSGAPTGGRRLSLAERSSAAWQPRRAAA